MWWCSICQHYRCFRFKFVGHCTCFWPFFGFTFVSWWPQEASQWTDGDCWGVSFTGSYPSWRLSSVSKCWSCPCYLCIIVPALYLYWLLLLIGDWTLYCVVYIFHFCDTPQCHYYYYHQFCSADQFFWVYSGLGRELLEWGFFLQTRCPSCHPANSFRTPKGFCDTDVAYVLYTVSQKTRLAYLLNRSVFVCV